MPVSGPPIWEACERRQLPPRIFLRCGTITTMEIRDMPGKCFASGFVPRTTARKAEQLKPQRFITTSEIEHFFRGRSSPNGCVELYRSAKSRGWYREPSLGCRNDSRKWSVFVDGNKPRLSVFYLRTESGLRELSLRRQRLRYSSDEIGL